MKVHVLQHTGFQQVKSENRQGWGRGPDDWQDLTYPRLFWKLITNIFETQDDTKYRVVHKSFLRITLSVI